MRGALLAVLAACSYEPREVSPDGIPTLDANDCFGTGANFTICVQLPAAVLAVDVPTTFDTDVDCTSVVTPPEGPELCVRAATGIAINSTLSVTGPRPLVLLATGSMSLTGTLDVASHRGGTSGPGANSAACSTTGIDGGNSLTGGGGGAGGSFGTKGGDGAAGDAGLTQQGVAAAATTPTFLRGGCKGGHGGTGGADATGGIGGDGGGAVYLLVAGSLDLSTGTINASGAGGTASPMPSANDGGGAGGGGSGGMIAMFVGGTLDAVGATIFANGGGGAEGGDKPNNCDPGDDPTGPVVGGLRGEGVCGAGGDGGDGAADVMDGFTGMEDSEGGGGGGGGVGIVKILSGQSFGSAAVSPPPT